MKIILIFCSLIIATAASPFLIENARTLATTENNTNYRLTGNTIPSRYDINLQVPQEVLNGTSTSFTGNVLIRFTITANTNTIRIHSLVNFTVADVTVLGYEGSSATSVTFPVSNITPDIETEITTITLESQLPFSNNAYYTLSIAYTGNLETVNRKGFYRSQYTVVNDITNIGTTEYLVTTQFQPTHARRVFPCFDEPQYKAVFMVAIGHPAEFTAVSNTPGTTNALTSTTTFQETPVMSTYTLAFTVSKFSCDQKTFNTVTYDVCSRTSVATKRVLALTYADQIISAMDTWTNVQYSTLGITKLHQFAIPDMGNAAMENWGLVTYGETMLLYDDLHSSNFQRQIILSTMAHELSHMWFGNSITTTWWDTLFLNEAFATYFEYFILNQITELASYDMGKQFILDQQKTALNSDGSITARSMTSEVLTPTQIQFTYVAYAKGASILRMVENIVGSANFQTSIREYINTRRLTSTIPEHLWANFNLNSQTGFTFTQFIESWTNQAGYPVIRATVSGNDIVLSQERFLYSGTDNSSTRWYVPISYKALNVSTATTIWLLPNNSVTIANANADNNWVLLNQGAFGYFRVHYDDTLRQKIISTLQTSPSTLSDIDRAQIIDDFLNLARSRHMNYTEVFQMLDYLRNETSYYPWSTALTGLNFLVKSVGNDTELGRGVNTRILELIESISSGISTTNWTSIDHITSIKLSVIWENACKAGQQNCISESRRLFQEFKNGTSTINPNIRQTVYCNALRHSSDATDWEFLWNRLQTFDDPPETNRILSSIGCTRDTSQLTFLLDQSINSTSIRIRDFDTLWSSVYKSSSEGLQVAFNHFTTNHSIILAYNPNAAEILTQIASLLSSSAQIQQLETFVTQQNGTTVGETASAALTTARENLEWQQRIEADLRTGLGISEPNTNIPGSGNSVTSTTMALSLMFAAMLMM